ncbi:myosin IC heavy chain-like [Vidua chalybeata]|uniref:myosin IC heavy chain-like n=1 Tax=Vidua chalybeata TaxID=81927 RepID=UPI0023A849A0|nr:myosin IC heavy chain-like [Vidua chalybeata]
MAGSRRAGKLPRPPTRRSPPAHGSRGRCALGAPPSAAVSVGPCAGRSVGPSPAAGGAAARCPPPRADTRALARPEVNTPRWPTRKRSRAAHRPAARGTPGGVVRARHSCGLPGPGSPGITQPPLRELRCPHLSALFSLRHAVSEPLRQRWQDTGNHRSPSGRPSLSHSSQFSQAPP